MSLQEQEPKRWAEINFCNAEMPDIRQVDRIVKIAAAAATKPGRSIPQLFENKYDVKAAYNLFNNSEATPDNIQAGHRELVLEELEKRSRYLLLEDTTELSWPTARRGLGPVGPSVNNKLGVHLHTVLAVKWTD